MVLFAHMADTHIGKRQYNLEEREEDFYRVFHETIDICIREHVDFVIHSGDLFESSSPSPRAFREALIAIKKLHEHGIKVYMIPGSHDRAKRRKSLPPQAVLAEIGVHVLRYRNPVDTFNNILIAGVQYTPKVFKDNLIKKLKDISIKAREYRKSILVLHQAIYKYLPFDYELTLNDLPDNFTYYAFGHVHKRILEPFGKGFIAYPGSTEVWSHDEYKEHLRNGKGIYIVDISGDLPEVHKINIKGIRPHIDLELNYPFSPTLLRKNFYKIFSNLESNLKPILHVFVKGKNIDRGIVRKIIQSTVGNEVLTFRLSFLEEEVKNLETINLSEVDTYSLLLKKLKTREYADFAYEMFKLLASNNVEEAKVLARKFYEKW